MARFLELPMNFGEPRTCAGCAYAAGLKAGHKRQESMGVSLASLATNQSGHGRQRDAYAAWALGYLDGVRKLDREPPIRLVKGQLPTATTRRGRQAELRAAEEANLERRRAAVAAKARAPGRS